MIGMAIASDDKVYVWYDDYFASAAQAGVQALLKHVIDIKFTWKSPAMVVGMGIARMTVSPMWYNIGTVSIGTSWDLDYYRAPYRFGMGNELLTSLDGHRFHKSSLYSVFTDGHIVIGTSNDLDRYRGTLCIICRPESLTQWFLTWVSLSQMTRFTPGLMPVVNPSFV